MLKEDNGELSIDCFWLKEEHSATAYLDNSFAWGDYEITWAS